MTVRKPRGILVADVPGWAFDINNDDAIEYCGKYFDFRKFFMSGFNNLPVLWDVDFVFCPWHRALNNFRNRTILGSLRSQWFNAAAQQPPTGADIALVNRCAGFHVVTRAVFDQLSPHCENVVYLTNPVNMRRFADCTTVRDEIVCAWNGNAQHASSGSASSDIKGYYSIVIPACSVADVKLISAEYNTCRLRPQQMPSFYRRANVALCASAYEGASNSVMEAMAAGLAVIVTDVGNHREMRDQQMSDYGESGIVIVDRDKESFICAIESLTPKRAHEMGQINRQSIIDRWSWDVWVEPYLNFYSMAVR